MTVFISKWLSLEEGFSSSCSFLRYPSRRTRARVAEKPLNHQVAEQRSVETMPKIPGSMEVSNRRSYEVWLAPRVTKLKILTIEILQIHP
jgi:hypothetical protein